MQRERAKSRGIEDGKTKKRDPLPPDRLATKKHRILFIGLEDQLKKTELEVCGATYHEIRYENLDNEMTGNDRVTIVLGPDSSESDFDQHALSGIISRKYPNAVVVAIYREKNEQIFLSTVIAGDMGAYSVDEFSQISGSQLLGEVDRKHVLKEDQRKREEVIKTRTASIKVLVYGCEKWRTKLEAVAAALLNENVEFEQIDKFPHLLTAIVKTTEPLVILFGPGSAKTMEDFKPKAETMVSCNRSSGNKARIIAIYNETTKTYPWNFKQGFFADAIRDTELDSMELNEWLYILDGTFGDMGSEPAKLGERSSVICKVVGSGDNFQVVDGREEIVDQTMTEFARSYMAHQRYTGHLATMDALLVRLKMHMGTRILDVGCGTGDPLRGFVRNVMMAEYTARPRLRDPTRILSVDSNEPMLAQCRAEFDGLKRARADDLRLLNMDYLISDLMDMQPEVLAGMGFGMPDTLLASYIIYWANDKLGAMRKFYDLLAPGGKLIVIEESPLVVTPSPHMPASLIEGIKKNIRVIPLEDYYNALRDCGFVDVPNGKKVYEIDDEHRMFGKVFEKK